jgi:hypothetical protein
MAKMRLGLLILSGAAGIGLAAWAAAPAERLQPNDIAAHVGQTLTVSGTVSDVFTDRRSGTTFIDMGGGYPLNRFAAVIFADDASTFPGVASLDGRAVKIVGVVRLYRGKPEIVLTSADQIETQ